MLIFNAFSFVASVSTDYNAVYFAVSIEFTSETLMVFS